MHRGAGIVIGAESAMLSLKFNIKKITQKLDSKSI